MEVLILLLSCLILHYHINKTIIYLAASSPSLHEHILLDHDVYLREDYSHHFKTCIYQHAVVAKHAKGVRSYVTFPLLCIFEGKYLCNNE